MKKLLTTALLALSLCFTQAVQAKVTHLLPKPQVIELTNGNAFALGRTVTITDPTDCTLLREFFTGNGCTVAWGATMQSAGVCELTSEPDALSFSLGAISANRSKHFAKVKELLELMGTVDIEDNFLGTRWSKLLINASFSGMSAVLGCTFGEAAKPRASRHIVQALIKECIDVCQAGGIRIEPVQGKDIVALLNYKNSIKKAFSYFIIPIAIRKHAKLKASMLQDIEKGKLTEVDAINGAVSDYGRKVSCPTPMNDRVVDIIHRIERGELHPSFDNLRYFK